MAHSGICFAQGAPQSSTPVYNYEISSYDPNGNIQAYTDSVNGSWSNIHYDNLNRLTGATQSISIGGQQTQQYFCWSYDSFGNRLAQVISPNPCSNPAQTTYYDEHSQVTSVSPSLPNGLGYDETGNVNADAANSYLYDAEGRVCAVAASVIRGGAKVQYIYDAEGHRVAKGSITTWSCDTSANGFIQTASYILGAAGEQITEIDGNGNWQHTNVYAAGQLIATFKNDAPAGQAVLAAPHFHLADWLGTNRVQLGSTGQPEETCQSLPFGDALNCSGAPDATEHHFTGKERDAETGLANGNDYFGARYYASSMGRWMSPDWASNPQAVPYANLGNPQSLNLYAYVGNNPLRQLDMDGHEFSSPSLEAIFNGLNDYLGGDGSQKEDNPKAQQQSAPQPGRQPDGSYIAPTGPGTPIGNITDPAKPLPPMIGNGQCVTACSRLSGVTADTSQWTPGAAVSGNGPLPIGTAIATFGSNGKFRSDGSMNSGIYMGQTKDGGILILDQWTAHPQTGTPEHHPAVRPLVYDRHQDSLSNSAKYYHVIIVP